MIYIYQFSPFREEHYAYAKFCKNKTLAKIYEFTVYTGPF